MLHGTAAFMYGTHAEIMRARRRITRSSGAPFFAAVHGFDEKGLSSYVRVPLPKSEEALPGSGVPSLV
jgi:hypothetical protein